MGNYYDISAIISEALRTGTDIAPHRMEWVKLCHALKILGESETTFAALSRCHGTPDKESLAKWRTEKQYTRYLHTESEARAFIAAIAKANGLDTSRLTLQQDERQHPRPLKPQQIRILPVEPQKEIRYINSRVVEKMRLNAKETALFFFISREWDTATAESVFNTYKIGGTDAAKLHDRQGFAVASLPYIDNLGNCVDCKLWSVDPTNGSSHDQKGKRIFANWALAMVRQSDHRAPWCNFGDHLTTARPNDTIAIVESEKSALIAAIALPQYVWVAVGSLNNLTPERCKQYQGRKVIICPDRDATKAWEEKAKALQGVGVEAQINYFVAKTEGEPKDDIADLLLRRRRGTLEVKKRQEKRPSVLDEAQKVWEQLKAASPCIETLEKSLNLQVIGIR